MILALNSSQPHVPYRDSKLTMILRDSLGGTARTWVVVNISPLERCAAETLSTLAFAKRAAEVRTRPHTWPTPTPCTFH